MRKLLSAAALATALLVSTAANAASMLFQFDTAHSKIDVLDQGGGFCVLCSLHANTTLAAGPFSIAEGSSQTFEFANLDINGILGGRSGVQLLATLAFVAPDVGDATSVGNGAYGTFLGILNGGHLTWSVIDPIVTSNGSKFNVSFENLSGIGLGDVKQHMTISVDKVGAIPEPGTWALLISGFGLMGAALRRRRQQPLALAA